MATWQVFLAADPELTATGADVTGVADLNDASPPAALTGATVNSVRFVVSFTGSGFSDDTWDVGTAALYLHNGTSNLATVTPSADATNGNETATFDITDSSPVSTDGNDYDGSNLSLTATGGASRTWATYTKNAGPDNANIDLDGGTASYIIIDYTPPVTECAGSADGTSTVTANLTQTHPVESTPIGTSSASADIDRIVNLFGSTAGVTSATGGIDFLSTVAEVQLASAGAPLIDTLHFVQVVAHVPTGDAVLTVSLVQGATVISTWQQALTNTETLYSLEVPVADAATITDYSDLRIRWQVREIGGYLGTRVDQVGLLLPVSDNYLEGASDGIGSVSATLTQTQFLFATSDGVAAVTGNLIETEALAGAISGTSTVTADLTEITNVRAESTSDGTSTVSGALVQFVALFGNSDGSTAATGDLLEGERLTGAIAGTSTVAGSLTQTNALTTTTDGVALVSSDGIAIIQQVFAQSDGTSTVTGDADKSNRPSGLSDGTSTASADIAQVQQINGQSDGSTSLAPWLTQAQRLAAASDGSAAIANSFLSLGFDGFINASSTVTGTLTNEFAIQFSNGTTTTSNSISFDVGTPGTGRLLVLTASQENTRTNSVTVDGKDAYEVQRASNSNNGPNTGYVWILNEEMLGASTGGVTIAWSDTDTWAKTVTLYTGFPNETVFPISVAYNDTTTSSSTNTSGPVSVETGDLLIMEAGQGQSDWTGYTFTSPLTQRWEVWADSQDQIYADVVWPDADTVQSFTVTFGGGANRSQSILVVFPLTRVPVFGSSNGATSVSATLRNSPRIQLEGQSDGVGSVSAKTLQFVPTGVGGTSTTSGALDDVSSAVFPLAYPFLGDATKKYAFAVPEGLGRVAGDIDVTRKPDSASDGTSTVTGEIVNVPDVYAGSSAGSSTVAGTLFLFTAAPAGLGQVVGALDGNFSFGSSDGATTVTGDLEAMYRHYPVFLFVIQDVGVGFTYDGGTTNPDGDETTLDHLIHVYADITGALDTEPERAIIGPALAPRGPNSNAKPPEVKR